MGATEPQTAADLERELDGWQVWQNICSVWYARPRRGPAIVVQGEDLTDLRDQIRGWLGRQH